ncbi:MAG TPA: zinc-binding dehydrogenase [Patescibacteria group bacterium]|nr:zinc-binding dehydrogenase [Patescibacteria group bacterium]
MKALVKKRPSQEEPWHQGLFYKDKPEPAIAKPDEVKLKVLAAAICGTDVSIYNATAALKNSMSSLAAPEVITGHEFCGEFSELGVEAKKIVAGKLYSRDFNSETISAFLKATTPAELAQSDRLLPFLKDNFYVTAEMHIVCGRCYQCTIGEGHVCRNTYIKGLHQDGAFAEWLVVPAGNLVLIAKTEIPLEIIAFMDAIGNAVHTVQAADVIGRNVLVLGAGIQGLMAVAAARIMGAAGIFITDATDVKRGLSREKLEKNKFAVAKKLGADYCFDVSDPSGRQALRETISRQTKATGVDVVLEMSGHYLAYQDAFDNIRTGGTLALLGLPSGTLAVDFSKEIIFRGLTVKGVIGRRIFDTWELMRNLLTNGLVEAIVKNKIVTHDLPLEKYQEGFKALQSGEALKVILRP